MELIMGPSNGWLYASGIIKLEKQKEVINQTNSTAIEIHLREDRNVEDELLNGPSLTEYDFRTLHLPKASEGKLDDLIDLARKLHEKHNYNYLLLHPDTIETEKDWIKLKESGLPIAIENMDKRKKSGIKISELKHLIEQYHFGLVLDVQHAYEHDQKMKYAKELLETFKNKIVYLHVSGENPHSIHALVKDSNNKREILDFLKEIFKTINVPIILEGKYNGTVDLKQEIDFLKKELTN